MLTKDQLNNLVNEFVAVQINEMTQEDIYAYLRDIMRSDIIAMNNHLTLQESIKEQIDEYDEHLYEKLEDYVTDKPDSYSALCEFLRDRQDNIYYDN